MKATDAIEEIISILTREYPDRRPLLEYDTPYQLLISVILSAQTTDAQVNEVTPILFTRYPLPADLAAARQNEVERMVQILCRRSKNNPILLGEAGVQRFVNGHTRDYIRRVSTHCSIGAAWRKESRIMGYFVLCREDR